MVKLIVSDIDGTLIPYGETSFSPRLLPLIEKLLDKGILFCPASGRQLHSLQQLFEPMSNRLPMLCENGAAVFGPGERENTRPVLGRVTIPRQDAMAMARDILETPQCCLFLSGTNTGYAVDSGFSQAVRAYTGNNTLVVADPEDIPEEIIKVSAYALENKEAVYARLAARWKDRYSLVYSGGGWVDISLTDKGKGLLALCKAYGLNYSETVAFGDNYNDLPMLEKAGRAYLMEGADPALKALIPNHCADVCNVLEEILRLA